MKKVNECEYVKSIGDLGSNKLLNLQIMKKLLLTLVFIFSCVMMYSYTQVPIPHVVVVPAVYHPAIHHSYFHHHSKPQHHEMRMKVRTEPRHKIEPESHFTRNTIPWYIITRPRHHDDTYQIGGKELKLCPTCHKRLIKKNMRTCNNCRKRH